MTTGPFDLVVSARGWARFRGRRLPCSIGRSGFVSVKREGDGGTLTGRFDLEAALWRPDRLRRPRLPVPTTPIRVWDGWSDDPSDPLYNQRVRRPRGYSHERLRRADPMYDLVVVMDANRRPIIAGGGSALFLHVWRGPRKPTAGCIAFRRGDLLWILERWTPRSRVIVAKF